MKNLKFEKPVSIVETLNDGNVAKFQIKPLERGYGLTIGNALRRVMLASMSGVAIVNVKIDGVEHEFSTIPGVYEDVMTIVLALKQVIIKADSNDLNFEQKIYLYKSGPGVVTAGDFEKVAGVEIINPDLKIATLAEKTDINITATIRRGVGYVSADNNKIHSKNELGVIAIDSLFSPIQRVAYHVEKTRGDDDELNLEVETDGSIVAKDAVGIACKMLIDYLEEIKKISEHEGINSNYLEEIFVEEKNPSLELSIVSLEGLKVPVLNALKKHSIQKVSELCDLTEDELSNFEQVGTEAIKNIKEVLSKYNLTLKSEDELTDKE